MDDNVIIKELKGWVEITCGKQKEFYQQQLKDAKPIEVSSIYDVFSPKEVKAIIKKLKPKAKQCYRNASLLCKEFAFDKVHNVKYVEGKYTALGAISLDHAFNIVDGHFVDITMELAIGKTIEDIKKETYVSLLECNANDLMQYELKSGVYGNVYSTKFLGG